MQFEQFFRDEITKRELTLPVISVPDIGLSEPEAGAPAVLRGVADWLINHNSRILEIQHLHPTHTSSQKLFDISGDRR